MTDLNFTDCMHDAPPRSGLIDRMLEWAAWLRGAAAALACSERGASLPRTGLHNTHTNVFSVFVFVQLYTGMAELTEYTIQVYNNCAHHARMKCTIQC